MKTTLTLLSAFGLLSLGSASAAMRCVDANSTNASPPYTNWTQAARVIQDAVDAAVPGDEIVVANGIYATGGRAVGTNVLVNRVAVDRPLTLRSVNGPQFTIIQGEQVPGTTNGDGAVRCVYLANGASLSGFTLTDGATRTNRDFWFDQTGGGVLGESARAGAVVTNCVLTGNSAYVWGGGACLATLNNCVLTGNSADGGGGACLATLNNCVLTRNSASGAGGGALGCALNNCTLTGNSARYGGGVGDGDFGSSSLTNCIVYFNTGREGQNNYCWGDSLDHCCTTPLPGSGNIALDPQLASASHLSASSPCRGAGGTANASGSDIDGEAWANPPSIGCDEYHAGAITGPVSVSIFAESTDVVVGFPIGLTALIDGRVSASVWNFGDGMVVSNRPFATHAWATPGDYTVTARAYNESHPEGVSATVKVHVGMQPVHFVAVGSTNPLAPYTSWATSATNIQDAVDAATSPGALVLVSNGVYSCGGRAVGNNTPNRVAVDKPLFVRSVNGPQFTVIAGDVAVRCVYLADGASLSGFTLTNGATRTSWDNWYDQFGGGVWCESEAASVSNCVLVGNSALFGGGGAYFGTLSDCTLAGNSASQGGGAYDSTLNNCVLANNSAPGGVGGGAAWATLNNCTLTGNSAGCGGGTHYGTLNNCTLMGNSASGSSGGANFGTLNNCTLTGNSASWSGGGASFGTLNNCIVYYNTAPNGPNYNLDPYGMLNFCCTTPMPTNGVGNITNAPLFVDYVGGNLRLQSNSPYMNAGNNAYVTSATDLDGKPRIVSGTVDIGAYEFQGPGSLISYAWLQQFGLPTDGSADATDADCDGHTLWQEWRCGTYPTNALSVLRLLSVWPSSNDITVTWQSVAGVSYFLERSTNLGGSPAFTALATQIPGRPGITTFTDTNAANPRLLFYRVGVAN